MKQNAQLVSHEIIRICWTSVEMMSVISDEDKQLGFQLIRGRVDTYLAWHVLVTSVPKIKTMFVRACVFACVRACGLVCLGRCECSLIKQELI